MAKKIVVLDVPLTDEQRIRLQKFGEVVEAGVPDSVSDLLEKTAGADVIYSFGDYLLESLPKLKNVFMAYPYIELGSFNAKKLKENGVYVANAKGGNRDSIVEWVMYMALLLFRKFGPKVRATKNIDFELSESLSGKKVLIIGHGNIGAEIGKRCEAFDMIVDYFKRGDDLLVKSRDADLIINALNCNSSSKNLLDKNFFNNVKKGSYFITFARAWTYDVDGLIQSLNKEIAAGAAIDCDPENFGDTENDFYQIVLACSKILVTPHIAFATRQASDLCKEIAVQNIESYLSGKPQNVINKN